MPTNETYVLQNQLSCVSIQCCKWQIHSDRVNANYTTSWSYTLRHGYFHPAKQFHAKSRPNLPTTTVRGSQALRQGMKGKESALLAPRGGLFWTYVWHGVVSTCVWIWSAQNRVLRSCRCLILRVYNWSDYIQYILAMSDEFLGNWSLN